MKKEKWKKYPPDDDIKDYIGIGIFLIMLVSVLPSLLLFYFIGRFSGQKEGVRQMKSVRQEFIEECNKSWSNALLFVLMFSLSPILDGIIEIFGGKKASRQDRDARKRQTEALKLKRLSRSRL